MQPQGIIAAIMSALLFTGGFMGFMKKGSKISFIAGASFSFIYAYVAASNLEAVDQSANNIGAGASGLLGVVMGYRFASSGFKAPLPAIIATLGFASGAALLLL